MIPQDYPDEKNEKKVQWIAASKYAGHASGLKIKFGEANIVLVHTGQHDLSRPYLLPVPRHELVILIQIPHRGLPFQLPFRVQRNRRQNMLPPFQRIEQEFDLPTGIENLVR